MKYQLEWIEHTPVSIRHDLWGNIIPGPPKVVAKIRTAHYTRDIDCTDAFDVGEISNGEIMPTLLAFKIKPYLDRLFGVVPKTRYAVKLWDWEGIE